MTQVGRPPHRLVGVRRSAHGHLEGVLLSEEQTDADVGAGLPSPIGEEPAVVEDGLVAPGLDVQRRQPGQAGLQAADEGIPPVSGFARKVLVLAYGTPLMRMRRWLGLNVGGCWPRLLGCAGNRRG